MTAEQQATHSPAPWRLSGKDKPGDTLRSVLAEDELVAIVFPAGAASVEDNARLIATAPDLLAGAESGLKALEGAHGSLEGEFGPLDEDDEIIRAKTTLRAAISLAKGEEGR